MKELTFDNFSLRMHERQLLADGAKVTLGSRAFDVLCVLAERAGQLVSKTQLFDIVWPGMVVEDNNLQVHISTLRKLLGHELIATIPGRGYRFTADVVTRLPAVDAAPVPAEPSSAALLASTTSARAIAVLPFFNLSDDASQEYFSDGLAEDIITKLTRSSWLFVIARNSSFVYRKPLPPMAGICRDLGTRYLVTGTVRRSGDTVRITADLVDGLNNETLWSQRFDRPLRDLFAVQEEIAASITSAIEPVYLRREEQRFIHDKLSLSPAHADPAATGCNLRHWELLMRARWHFWRSAQVDIDSARDLLTQAMAIKPNDSSALALMSFTHMSRVWAGWAPDAQAEIMEANRLALQAVRKEDTDAYAHFTLGTALSCAGNVPQAIAEQEHALVLYPEFAAAAGELGRLLAFSGRTQESEEYVLQAIDASPHDPHLSLWVRTQALSRFVDKDYGNAIKYALRATSKRPDWFFNHYLLAACQAGAGDIERAKQSLVQGQLQRSYTLQVLRIGHPFTDEQVFARYVDLLRQAGWAP